MRSFVVNWKKLLIKFWFSKRVNDDPCKIDLNGVIF